MERARGEGLGVVGVGVWGGGARHSLVLDCQRWQIGERERGWVGRITLSAHSEGWVAFWVDHLEVVAVGYLAVI